MKIFRFFKGWSFERYFKLIIAALIAIYSISSEQYFLLLISGWLAVVAFLNISCCSSGNCNEGSCQRPNQE